MCADRYMHTETHMHLLIYSQAKHIHAHKTYYAHAYTQTQTHIFRRTHKHIHIHTETHIHIHTYLHTESIGVLTAKLFNAGSSEMPLVQE